MRAVMGAPGHRSLVPVAGRWGGMGGSGGLMGGSGGGSPSVGGPGRWQRLLESQQVACLGSSLPALRSWRGRGAARCPTPRPPPPREEPYRDFSGPA